MIRKALALIALTSPAAAADVVPETPEARAALGEELRELLYVEPDLVRPALGADPGLASEIAQGLYADDIASDLQRIESEAALLFGPDRPRIGSRDAPVRIALLVTEACSACDAARRELAALAARIDVAATVIDVSRSDADRAMMDRLTLDITPSYVMPDKMIRGHMPPIALERYLSE